MTTPAQSHLLRMTSSSVADAEGRGGGVAAESFGPIQGRSSPLGTEWHPKRSSVLGGSRQGQAVRLLAGPYVEHSTRITDGDLADDGRVVEGNLYEILRPIRRLKPDGGGTRTRDQDDAASRLRPTGLAAIRGRALLDTPEGLGRLDGFLMAGGYPRTEFDEDGQAGRIVVAADILGRWSTFRRDGRATGLSMPVRFETPDQPGARRGGGTEQFFADDPNNPLGPGTYRTFAGEDNEVVSERRGNGTNDAPGAVDVPALPTDVTGRPNDENVAEVWGVLAPYDLEAKTHLDSIYRQKDPEGYQKIARHAPYFLIDVDKLVGKPKGDPPPEDKPPPKKPDPPPGGGGGGDPDPKKPDPQEERITKSQAAPGLAPTGNQVAVPETAQPVTEAIDDGAGNEISAEKEGIDRIDGAQQDQDDYTAGGGGLPTVDQASGGGPGGANVSDPAAPAECPIGGRHVPEVIVDEVVIAGDVYIRTTVDGVVTDLVRKTGGVLSPTNADGQQDELQPPPGGNGQVTDGRITKTYKDGRVVDVTRNSGGVLSPTQKQLAAGLDSLANTAANLLGGL